MVDRKVKSAQTGAAGYSLLDSLTGAALEELMAIAQPISFLKGAILLRQGGHTRGAFFLRMGQAQASVRLPGGESLIVAQVEEGGVIGEMALLEHGICSATVTALSNVDGFFIGRDDFRVLVARRSPAALVVQQAVTLNLCAKLEALNAQTLAWPTAEDAPYVGPTPRPCWMTAAKQAELTFDYRSFLPMLPFFQGWDAEEIVEFSRMTVVLSVKRGQVLFHEDETADACFVTVRGAVDIAAPIGVVPTHLRRMAVLGPGRLVGYRSLIEGKPHSSRARTCEDSVILALRSDQFLALYQGTDSLSYRLQNVVHGSLLRSMAQTNVLLTRLANIAKVDAAKRKTIEAAIALQAIYVS